MKRKWKNLKKPSKATLISMGIVQVTLLIYALADIYKRPFYQVRGKKKWWATISFINYIGPVIYLLFGRKTKAYRPDFI